MKVCVELLFDLADTVNVRFMVEVVLVGRRREGDPWETVSQSGNLFLAITAG